MRALISAWDKTGLGAFAAGLADVARAAEHDAEARRLLGELESVGISALWMLLVGLGK